MFRIIILSLSFFCANHFAAQINCSTIKVTGVKYTATAFKHGKGKLLPTDSVITNQMKQKTFELKKAGELSPEEKAELLQYKIKFNDNDTLMFYDWDIIHEGKVGYFGKAVARVKINCTDSMVYTYTYLLNKDSQKYVPNQFKIIRMNQNDFILNDRIHPYLNINYYFKKN